MSATTQLEMLRASDTGRITACGSWTAPHACELDHAFEDIAAASWRQPALAVDLRGVTELDTYGAWLLERFIRARREQGYETEITGVADRCTGILENVGAVPRDTNPARRPKHNHLWGVLENVGRAAYRSTSNITAYAALLGALGESALAVMRWPKTFRLTSMIHHLDRVGWQAVPIILLINFLIGGIIAQQEIFHFRKFGAEVYVVDMVGILVLREIGVLIVSIMLAGRSGSSFTAELCSMKMREEIDALRTMGFDAVDVLVLPRVVALIIALPALTFLGSMAALYGGGLVTWFYGGMHPDIFLEHLRDAVSVTHFKVGLIKAPFMAAVIGLVACAEGLRVKGSAQSLGEKTTSSVVRAIFLVIVLDGLFAVFFASIDV